MSTILHNRALCLLCFEIIESKHRHDFVSCSCGNISVDGGKEYIKRVGDIFNVNSIDLSEDTDDTPVRVADI